MSEILMLKPAQVAELLGLSRSKIYELAQAGELPGSLKIGGSIRVHRPTLEAWLAKKAAAGAESATAQEVRHVRADHRHRAA